MRGNVEALRSKTRTCGALHTPCCSCGRAPCNSSGYSGAPTNDLFHCVCCPCLTLGTLKLLLGANSPISPFPPGSLMLSIQNTPHLSVQMLQGSLLTKQTSLPGAAGDRSVDNENSDSSFNILDFIVSTEVPQLKLACL